MAEKKVASQVILDGKAKSDCEQEHKKLVSDPETWDRLQIAGVQRGFGRDLYEIRRCPACGSHVNRPIDAAEALGTLNYLGSVLSRSLDGLASYSAADPSYKAGTTSCPKSVQSSDSVPEHIDDDATALLTPAQQANHDLLVDETRPAKRDVEPA